MEMLMEFIVAQKVLALFIILTIGMSVGYFSWRGMSLGASAVLLTALVFGHFGVSLPKEITELGLVIFVFAIGLQVGPSFFKAFKEKGKLLAIVCTLGLTASAITTVILAKLFNIPADIASGMFAGSNTSTPALAAAIELASKAGLDSSNISVGYGISYPFSIIVVVLIIQLLPDIFKKRSSRAEEEWKEFHKSTALVVKSFSVDNPMCIGKAPTELHPHHFGKINISRVCRDSKFLPATDETKLQKDDVVIVTGMPKDVKRFGMVLGKEQEVYIQDYEIIGQNVNVFSSKFIGKTIRELSVWHEYNVVITRIIKHGYEIPALGDYELEYGDILHAVGKHEEVEKFTQQVSDIDRKTNDVNFIPFLLGITLGIIIGLSPIEMFGVRISLGMATGAFLSSLVIGYYGKIGPFKMYVPQAASNLTRDLGLMLFLAGVGTSAGSNLLSVLQTQGFSLFVAGMILTMVTIMVPLIFLSFSKQFHFYAIIGTLSGFMTNLPAIIGARGRIDVDKAMSSYATIYTFALILKILFIQLLMIILQNITSMPFK